MGNLFSQMSAAKNYVEALHDLPPTYSMEKHGFKQVVPDPVMDGEYARKIKILDQREKQLNASFQN